MILLRPDRSVDRLLSGTVVARAKLPPKACNPPAATCTVEIIDQRTEQLPRYSTTPISNENTKERIRATAGIGKRGRELSVLEQATHPRN